MAGCPLSLAAAGERLCPVVLLDLKKLAATVDNDNDLDPEYLNDLWGQCRFSRVNLGSLGSAILIASNEGGGAANFGMLNLYLPDGNSYRRILAEAGFGPNTFAAPAPSQARSQTSSLAGPEASATPLTPAITMRETGTSKMPATRRSPARETPVKSQNAKAANSPLSQPLDC
jgi:hypothetical protein